MTNAEKRDLRVWAFEAVSRRRRDSKWETVTSFGPAVEITKAPELLELIGEADALAEWVASGGVKL